MKPWRRKTLVSLALVRCCHFHSNRGGAATDVNTRVIYSTRNTFRLTSLFPAQRTKGRVWGGEAGKRSVWGGAAPNVTCPQRAVGPVEEEYGVRAQPRQRLVRRGPGVLEEPLLAVVIEQRLRKKGRGSPAPTLRPGTAAGTPRPPPSPAAPIPPSFPAAPSLRRRGTAVAPTCCTSASIVATQRHRGGAPEGWRQRRAIGLGGKEAGGTREGILQEGGGAGPAGRAWGGGMAGPGALAPPAGGQAAVPRERSRPGRRTGALGMALFPCFSWPNVPLSGLLSIPFLM